VGWIRGLRSGIDRDDSRVFLLMFPGLLFVTFVE